MSTNSADINYRWKSGDTETRFFLRPYRERSSLWWQIGQLFCAKPCCRPIEFSWTRNTHVNDECYCSEGSVDRFRFRFFWWAFWGTFSRDHVRRPCICSRVMWAVYPEEHIEEIEYFGVERFLWEFPKCREVVMSAICSAGGSR